MKLLYAEDEPAMSEAVTDILTYHNYSVDAVYDGADALAYALSETYDGIILDVMMPKMSGLEVLRRLREAGCRTPVLLLTAFDDAELIGRATDAGVLAYLVKPVEAKHLFPAMEIALSRWQETEALEKELSAMRDSLETRKLLDRAKGILMQAHHISEDEAYRRMQRYSMEKRRSLKDIAAAVVQAGAKKRR